MNQLRFFTSMLYKHRKDIYICFFLSFSFLLIDIGIPYLYSSALGEITKSNSSYQLYAVIGITFVFAVVGVISVFEIENRSSKIASAVASDLRNDMIEMAVENKRTAADLINRFQIDVTQIRFFIKSIFNTLIIVPIILPIAFYLFITRYSENIIAVIMVIFIVGISTMYIINVNGKYAEKIETIMESVNQWLMQILKGFNEILLFGKRNDEKNRFINKNNQLASINKKYFFWENQIGYIFDLTIVLMNASFFYHFFLSTKGYQINDVVFGLELAYQVAFSVTMVCMILSRIPKVKVSLERIMSFLEPNQEMIECHEGEIEPPTLPENAYVIVGKSGSGKSTISKNICASLSNQISSVVQNFHLFQGTIKENIFFDEVERMQNADELLSICCVDEIIQSKENGIDEQLVNNGSNISGGQRQRIAIARALAKDAEVYCFDEAFSAIDITTRNQIIDTMLKKYNHAKLIFVTQKKDIVEKIENVIFVDNYKIVDINKHNVLYESCKEYREYIDVDILEEGI